VDDKTYDILIIGGGPAGLSAGIYGGRSLLKTGIIERMGPGGQMNITDSIANYPGFPTEIHGYELGARMTQQAQNFGVKFIPDEVIRIAKIKDTFEISCKTSSYSAKSVIIASGASNRKLGVPGEGRLRGRGVSYCATCDGAFFKDKIISIVGGGDSSLEEAMYLSQFGNRVFIIHRRQGLRANPKYIHQTKSNDKIEFILDTVVESINGDQKVENLTLRNKVDDSTSTHKTDGVFISIGYVPNTSFLDGFVKLNDQGYIATDEKLMTNVSGVFAAGDVIVKDHKQVVTAVADGAVASINAWQYLTDMKGTR